MPDLARHNARALYRSWRTCWRTRRGLTVLVTSCAVVHLSGEHEFPVPPFALPDPKLPLDTLAETEAVQLFVTRT